MLQSTLIVLSAALGGVLAQKGAAAAGAGAAEGCPPVELVYARATTEPPQNAKGDAFTAAANRIWSKGFGAAGFSLLQNITALIPGSTGYPVHYPASFAGCSSEDPGIQDMTNRLKTRSQSCPSTVFVLGGHSQGAFVTARTLVRLPQDLRDKIIAVTSFGAPPCMATYGIADRCRSFCHKGDEVCDSPGSVKSKGKCADAAILAGISGGKAKGGKGKVSILQERGEAVAAVAPISPAECLKPSPLGAQSEKGLVVGGKNSHMAYNSNGKYIKEAACFVYRQYQAAKGGKAA